MKNIAVFIAFLFCLVGTKFCFAESGIPNLVGTWIVKVDGGVVTKAGKLVKKLISRENSAALRVKRW